MEVNMNRQTAMPLPLCAVSAMSMKALARLSLLAACLSTAVQHQNTC
jgi:hypothetical protein